MSHRKLAALGTALLFALVFLTGPALVSATGPCTHAGFTIHENDYPFSGDSYNVCATSLLNPTTAKRTDFSVNPGSANLNNGCARPPFNGSTWNDCVSGVEVWGLPSGYKIVGYSNSGYSGQVWCIDTNGSHGYSMITQNNDLMSSMRIISGDC